MYLKKIALTILMISLSLTQWSVVSTVKADNIVIGVSPSSVTNCPDGYDYDDDDGDGSGGFDDDGDGYGDDDDGDGYADCQPVQCPSGFDYDDDDGDSDGGYDDDSDGYGDDDDGDGYVDCVPVDPTPEACEPVVDAIFSADGLSVTVSSTKGLSNVVLVFSDGTTQKFEFDSHGDDDDDDGGSNEIYQTTLSAGKIITGVYIKSGCNSTQPGLGEYVDACPTGLTVGFGPDQVIGEPLINDQSMFFQVEINQAISTKSCVVTANYATQDGAAGFQTATADSDYTAVSGTLSFTAGDPLVQEVEVVILATGIVDPTEAFTISLTNITKAAVTDSEAVGVIETIEF